jgi:predicted membrane protein
MMGIIIILRRTFDMRQYHERHDERVQTDSRDDYIDDIAVFSGHKHMVYSQNFKGGKIASIFGGSEIDFTRSKLAEGKNVLEVLAIFGGASIKVPNDWNVRVEMGSVLGGFADKRHINPETFAANQNKELIIKGVAIFGGGEIKSY